MNLERLIGVVLRAGVMISTSCLAVGLLLSLATGGHVLAAVLLNIGIVVLLATPLARVIVSTVQYIGERDWLFATLTLVVLLSCSTSGFDAGSKGTRPTFGRQKDPSIATPPGSARHRPVEIPVDPAVRAETRHGSSRPASIR